MKKCSRCKIEKELIDFNKNKSQKDGLQTNCKICIKKFRKNNKEKQKEYSKKYYLKNKEKPKEYNKEYRKEYYLKNKENFKKYYEKNKEKQKEYYKKYYLNNKEKRNKYVRENQKKRRLNDNLFKLKCNIITSIGKSFRRNGYSKKSRTYQILGCTYE